MAFRVVESPVPPVYLATRVDNLKSKVRQAAPAPTGDVWPTSERSHIWARLDSGADITVVRRSLLPMQRIEPRGNVILKGDFGHSIEARQARVTCFFSLCGVVTVYASYLKKLKKRKGSDSKKREKKDERGRCRGFACQDAMATGGRRRSGPGRRGVQ
ncbi:hypothetical protein HPB48_012841 [Haemaphysalis longicornis]|uniref:Peptidase A2 domain-containing protein n=1 Tax=Haemaphysalis longicornis TaxID=44386 RepID=A0A9J6FR94_HAELO|nr:hypothetical protein HPB48_012841 [Haemaphysalis longicornis]